MRNGRAGPSFKDDKSRFRDPSNLFDSVSFLEATGVYDTAYPTKLESLLHGQARDFHRYIGIVN